MLGHHADEVRRALPESVDVVVAVAAARDRPRGPGRGADAHGSWAPVACWSICGDEALVRPDSLRRLVDCQVGDLAPVALLTARVSDPRGYGRVIRLDDGHVARMVEEVDATPEERAVDEIWSGTMLVHAPWLWANLDKLPLSPKGEYYLPDLVNLARAQGLAIHATLTEDEEEVLGVNDRAQLAQANAVLRQRKIDRACCIRASRSSIRRRRTSSPRWRSNRTR